MRMNRLLPSRGRWLWLALAVGGVGRGVGAPPDSEEDSEVPTVGRHLDDFELQRSPGGAALRSLVFPGLGQWHTGHRRKAAVAFVAEASLAAWIAYETPIVRGALADSRFAGETQTQVNSGQAPNYERYIQHFEFRRDLVVYLVVTAVGFAVDAYVDARFYGFEAEFDGFPEPHLTPNERVDGVELSLSIPFR